jgi:maltose alpha-D-glucosyltransferase/alpha-amylase
LGSSVLHFTGNDLMKQHLQTGLSKPRVHNDRKGNTEISFENEVLLRLYRRVDREPHPDVELSRFLSLEAGFEYAPPYLGTIDWMLEKDSRSHCWKTMATVAATCWRD